MRKNRKFRKIFKVNYKILKEISRKNWKNFEENWK